MSLIKLSMTTEKIPKVIHYIFFNDPHKRSGRMSYDFNIINFLCVKSAILNIQPEKAYFYTNIRPETNTYLLFLQRKLGLEFVFSAPPEEIFGNKIRYVHHKSDVFRLKKLYKMGGIYLDTDVFVVKSFDDLLDKKAVLGKETKSRIGLAVILTEKANKFIKDWLDSYFDFNGSLYKGHSNYTKIKDKEEKEKQRRYWIGHSIIKMQELVESGRHDVTLLDKISFYEPANFYVDFNEFLNSSGEKYKESYCHHLCLSVRTNLRNMKSSALKKKGYFYEKAREVFYK